MSITIRVSALFSTQPSHLTTSNVQGHLGIVTETTHSRQSPFYCDGGHSKHLPGAYTVYLAAGHSIQQYSTTIQKDINPHIHSVLGSIIIHKTFYHAADIDEILLSAIRSHPKVYLVECGHNKKPAQDAAAKYQAPLLCHSESRIPESYAVFLSPGWTLEQHSAAIDQDLTPYIRWVLDRKILDRVVYHGEDTDDELLANDSI